MTTDPRCGCTDREGIHAVTCRFWPQYVTPPTACISCTVDTAERVDCLAWDDECLTCHLTRCASCQDALADQDAAEARFDGRWT